MTYSLWHLKVQPQFLKSARVKFQVTQVTKSASDKCHNRGWAQMTWNIFSKSFELTLNKSHDHVEIYFRYFLPHHSSFFPLPPTTGPFHQTSKQQQQHNCINCINCINNENNDNGWAPSPCFTYIFLFLVSFNYHVYEREQQQVRGRGRVRYFLCVFIIVIYFTNFYLRNSRLPLPP